jgi:deoxyribonuclease-4
MTRRMGVHVSIAGGVSLAPARAHGLGCTCMQIFSHSPRQWALAPISPREAEAFRAECARFDIAPVFVHASYLLNVASADDALRDKSIAMLREEMLRAEAIGAAYVVLHPGIAHDAMGRRRASESIREAMAGLAIKAGLLIENTSGKRGDIATTPAELAEIVDGAQGAAAGVCIDTAHANSAGYDLRAGGVERLGSELGSSIGFSMIRLVHLNDSRAAAGSGADRHADIGEGTIGVDALRETLAHRAFQGVPVVLETPKQSGGDDLRNLAAARALLPLS